MIDDMMDNSIYYMLADSFERDALWEASELLAVQYKAPNSILIPLSLCTILWYEQDGCPSTKLTQEIEDWCIEHINFSLETKLHEFAFTEPAKMWGTLPFHYEFYFQIITFSNVSDWLAFKLRWL